MWIIKLSLKNPYLVGTIVFTLIVLGLLAVSSIPIDILPVLHVPAIRTLTYYPGMPAETMEKTMTNTVERYCSFAVGVDRVESRSITGVSEVTTYIKPGTDLGSAVAQTAALANSSLARLPPNTLQPISFPYDPTGTLPLRIVSVTSPTLGEARLKDLTKYDVRARLNGIHGAVALGVFGGKDRAIMVYVDPVRLQAREMSQEDVVNALQAGNLLLSPGVAKFGPYEFWLDSNALVRSAAELNDFPIRADERGTVFVRDVARAEDSYNIQTSLVRIDGRRTVYAPVNRAVGASSLAVVNQVREVLPQAEASVEGTYGEPISLSVVMDQSFYVREAIKGLVHEGVVGVLLVSVMILVFLGNWRMTLIATLSIPLAVLGSVIGLWLTGNTLNVMTLAGLSLAIGPLVDDAVVELENNHRNYMLGKSRIKAALDGCSQVLVPVLVATSSTILVLSPLTLMPGLNGQLFRPLALAVAFAMITSFLLSRTFVPMLCARFLPDTHTEPAARDGAPCKKGVFSRGHERFEALISGVKERYRRLLDVVLRRRGLVLALVFAVFLLSLTQLYTIGQEFFPAVDAGMMTIYVRCPSGTNIETTEKRLEQFEKFLHAHIAPADLQRVIIEIGIDTDYSAAYSANAASWDAIAHIQLTPARSLSSQQYAARLRQLAEAESAFADMRFTFNTGGMIQSTLDSGAICPISVQMRGGSEEEATAVARRVRDRLAAIAGTADVHVLQRDDAPRRTVRIDRAKAAQVGLSEQDVIAQVTAAMNSSQYVKRNIFLDFHSGTQYWIAVQYPENLNMRLEDMLNIVATGTKTPEPVKLSSLVRIERDNVPVEVNHVEFARVLDVLVNLDGRDLGSAVSAVKEAMRELEHKGEIPPHIRWDIKGQYQGLVESFYKLGAGLILAVLLVYFMLVGLFRSFTGPLVILLTVPLALIGVLTCLNLTGTTLNVQSGLGVIFLIGIAVSNGVLLVDFANRERKQGKDAREAVVAAALTRFRPILMTFLAAFLALLPMAIGLGRGSEANIPLGRAIVGGLLTSTLFTLFVVPAAYTLLMTGHRRDLDAEVEAAMKEP